MHTRPPHDADDTIRRLIQWGEGQPAIRVLLLTSTRALPNADVDVLSDYDVILVVDDIQPFHADRAWLNAFGEVVVGYWDSIQPDPDFGIEFFGNVIQYVDGLKIDFTLWPAEMLTRIIGTAALPAELDAGYRILLDKDRLTSELKPPTYQAYIVRAPNDAAFQKTIEDFYSNAPYVAKCLLRGELLPMKWALDDDMKHLFLRQMLEWRMAMDHDWAVTAGANGKGLKKHLPPDLWAQLEQTYAGAGIAENWVALDKTMALFRQVAMEVAARLGYVFPESIHERVGEFVDKMRLQETSGGPS